MERPRLLVAVLVPPPVAAEVDGLRRAAGDRARERIAPHVTLVPPTNVAADEVGAALAVVRSAAAAATGPLALALGPVTTFTPPNRVAFLAVGGPDAEALDRLQGVLGAGPFARPRTRPFVPHVTVRADLAPARRDAWVAAGADYAQPVTVSHVHVLAQHPTGDGFRWVVVGDAPLGPPVVVGRGGLPLVLSEHTVVDAEVAGALGLPATEPRREPEPDLVVAVARRHGVVVGGAAGRHRGSVAHVRLVVVPEERGTGVGSRTLEAVELAAERRGAGILSVAVEAPAVDAFLRARGYHGAEGASALARRLARGPAETVD